MYDPLVYLVFVTPIGKVDYPIVIFLVVKTRDKIIGPVSNSFPPSKLYRFLRYLSFYVIFCDKVYIRPKMVPNPKNVPNFTSPSVLNLLPLDL